MTPFSEYKNGLNDKLSGKIVRVNSDHAAKNLSTFLNCKE